MANIALVLGIIGMIFGFANTLIGFSASIAGLALAVYAGRGPAADRAKSARTLCCLGTVINIAMFFFHNLVA